MILFESRTGPTLCVQHRTTSGARAKESTELQFLVNGA
jgi:hypothetical protein